MQHVHTHLKIIPTKSFDAAKLIMQQLSHLKVREICCTKKNGMEQGMGDGEKTRNRMM
jgi:hypothetical protein